MAVILPNSAILHIPKTGGQFVRDVLDHNGIEYRQTGRRPCTGDQRLFNRAISSHCLPYDPEFWQFVDEGKVLAFVRHPLTWYQSYWAYRVMHKPGNPGANPLYYWRATDVGIGDHGYAQVDEFTHNDIFTEWIDKVLLMWPGAYSAFIKYFTNLAGTVGKTETLAEDLTAFLYEHEGIEQVDANIKRTNTTEKQYKDLAVYGPGQAEKLCGAERWVIDEYYSEGK